MAILSDRAERQVDRLLTHFLAKDREEAAIGLRGAVASALAKADDVGQRTRAYPSVYRGLSGLGFRWIRVAPYWFALEATSEGNAIALIFYERANIPARIDEAEESA